MFFKTAMARPPRFIRFPRGWITLALGRSTVFGTTAAGFATRMFPTRKLWQASGPVRAWKAFFPLWKRPTPSLKPCELPPSDPRTTRSLFAFPAVGIRIASRSPSCKAKKSSKLGLTAAQIKGLEEDSNGHSYSPATNLRSRPLFLGKYPLADLFDALGGSRRSSYPVDL